MAEVGGDLPDPCSPRPVAAGTPRAGYLGSRKTALRIQLFYITNRASLTSCNPRSFKCHWYKPAEVHWNEIGSIFRLPALVLTGTELLCWVHVWARYPSQPPASCRQTASQLTGQWTHPSTIFVLAFVWLIGMNSLGIQKPITKLMKGTVLSSKCRRRLDFATNYQRLMNTYSPTGSPRVPLPELHTVFIHV